MTEQGRRGAGGVRRPGVVADRDDRRPGSRPGQPVVRRWLAVLWQCRHQTGTWRRLPAGGWAVVGAGEIGARCAVAASRDGSAINRRPLPLRARRVMDVIVIVREHSSPTKLWEHEVPRVPPPSTRRQLMWCPASAITGCSGSTAVAAATCGPVPRRVATSGSRAPRHQRWPAPATRRPRAVRARQRCPAQRGRWVGRPAPRART